LLLLSSEGHARCASSFAVCSGETFAAAVCRADGAIPLRHPPNHAMTFTLRKKRRFRGSLACRLWHGKLCSAECDSLDRVRDFVQVAVEVESDARKKKNSTGRQNGPFPCIVSIQTLPMLLSSLQCMQTQWCREMELGTGSQR
jgi:hypothetical protein